MFVFMFYFHSLIHLQHRLPLRPGLGRPLMMGSRLRPMIRHPPVGFPRPGPAGGNPPRINEVTVSQLPQKFNKECDYFSDELCLLVQDYPMYSTQTCFSLKICDKI